MRPLHVAVVAALVIALAACGGEEAANDGGGCPDSGDTVRAARPIVRVSSECDGLSFDVTSQRSMVDGSTVRVRPGAQGNGRAFIAFSDIGVCTLLQLQPDKPAVVETRLDEALFRQLRGKAKCTLRGAVETICRGATVELSGEVTQARIGCDPDPVLSVAPYRGDATVTLRSGEEYDLGAGQELNVYPDPTVITPAPEVVPAEFTAADVTTFQNQAEMMGVGFQLLTPTPSPLPTITPTLALPTNVMAPVVRWQVFQEVLVADTGTWDGAPDSYTISWEVACARDGSACRATGATGATYSPVYNEDCYFVRALVTATNAAGSASAASAPFDITCID